MPMTITANALAHFGLDEAATCFCWRIVPRLANAPAQPAFGLPAGYGVPEGYTSLDRDLIIDGLVYSSSANVMPTSVPCSIGLEIDGVDATLLFPESARLQQERVELRIYDGALVHLFALPWEAFLSGAATSVDIAPLLAGRLGAADLDDNSAQFELLPWSAFVGTNIGRTTGETCDVARFGCGRCRNLTDGSGVDIRLYGRTQNAQIVAAPVGESAHGMRLWISGIGKPNGWANFGVLRIASGPLTGAELPIKEFLASGEVRLRTPSPIVPDIGTLVQIEEGCDRTRTMCLTKSPNPGAPRAGGNMLNNRSFRPSGQRGLVKSKTSDKRPAGAG